MEQGKATPLPLRNYPFSVPPFYALVVRYLAEREVDYRLADRGGPLDSQTDSQTDRRRGGQIDSQSDRWLDSSVVR